jgi:hypothetical protein
MSVPPTIRREPIQSTAFRPSQTGVLGLSRWRKKKRATATVPVMGTGLLLVYDRFFGVWKSRTSGDRDREN